MSGKIAVILTAYNPNVAELTENLRSYASQVDVVILSDNSDVLAIQQQVRLLAEQFGNVVLNQLFENVGIARAQNLGLELAKNQGCDFFIEMDQDSKLPEGYVSALLRHFLDLDKGRGVVGGIGPIATKKDTSDVYTNVDRGSACVEVEYTLSSGFLMPLHAVEKVGPKNEDLFIDFVDWEWCWRSREQGLRVYVDTTLEIIHMLGDGHKRVLGLNIGIPSPIRHYYQFRNFLYLLRKRYVPWRWKAKYLLIMTLKPFAYLALLDRKAVRLRYVGKGIKDGIIGRFGKIGQ